MTISEPTLEPRARDGLTVPPALEVEPSAFGDDLHRFVTLTYVLARTDFKLRYFGSSLGYLWSLIRPLLFFGVMYVVFTQIFHAGHGVKGYAAYLLNAIVTWTFFTETTTGCVQCMVQREGLLRKMRFPRLAIPLAVCLTALFNFCLNFVTVLVFAAIDGVTPRIGWLEMPVLMVLWTMLAVGLGMILSVLYVRFRDMQPIWEVVTQVLFYAPPIILPVTLYPASIQRIAMISPIATLLTQMRHTFVDPTAPSAATEIGGAIRLLIPIGIIVAVFFFGLWFLRREAPNIAEQL
ncbi:MAG TPA: ABC transporter permease [Solirubrobacteraceae bacterium]|nr:ABC transporter permease [Solirubrobacteraceae bacterium]